MDGLAKGGEGGFKYTVESRSLVKAETI
jgi:hypothetical protein